MEKTTPAICAALALLTVARYALAQPRPEFHKESARATLDFRVGAMWPGQRAVFAPEKTRSSFGFRIAPYLGQGRLTHRLSAQVGLDYIPVSHYDYFDPVLSSDARFREQLLIVNPALGFDIVQTPRVDLTVRYGGALVGNLTTFELPNTFGEWEDVCHLQVFEGSCPSKWNFVGTGGAGLRIFPKKEFGLYLGVDYTRYAGFKNQFVGLVGFAF